MSEQNGSPSSADLEEEAKLLSMVLACHEKETAAFRALTLPTRSVLMQGYWERQENLEGARAEFSNAKAALREYRARMPGQAAKNSK